MNPCPTWEGPAARAAAPGAEVRRLGEEVAAARTDAAASSKPPSAGIGKPPPPPAGQKGVIGGRAA